MKFSSDSRLFAFPFLLCFLCCLLPATQVSAQVKKKVSVNKSDESDSGPVQPIYKPVQPKKDSTARTGPRKTDSGYIRPGQELLQPSFRLKTNSDEVVTYLASTDSAAVFPGGEDSLYSFINSRLNISCSGTEPYAYLLFGIDSSGRIGDVKLVDYDKSCPELVLQLGEIIPQLPRWKPAMHNGLPVAAWYRLHVEHVPVR